MRHPLDGLTVVSLEQAVAAPFATRQLADLGARVIKIERPGGGDFARGYDKTTLGQSSHFIWLNRGKESVELDVKDPGDRDLLGRLIDAADVFVQNLAPGAADRLGLSPSVLRADRPGLICCSISGYGPDGPYREKKAYDLLVQCEAGLLSVTGTPEAPAKAGISVADIAAGMYAYSGILAALYQRSQTGQGRVLEVSMLEALGEWMGYPYLYGRYGSSDPPRTGASHATIAPYGPVVAGSKPIVIGLQNEPEWAAFCAGVLHLPELAVDERFASNSARVAHRAELDELVNAAFAARDYDAIVRDLDQAGIAWARQRSMTEFAEHPQLAARDRWRTVHTPNGDVEALLPPVTTPSWASPMGAVPEVGQHTEAILDWLNLPAD